MWFSGVVKGVRGRSVGQKEPVTASWDCCFLQSSNVNPREREKVGCAGVWRQLCWISACRKFVFAVLWEEWICIPRAQTKRWDCASWALFISCDLMLPWKHTAAFLVYGMFKSVLWVSRVQIPWNKGNKAVAPIPKQSCANRHLEAAINTLWYTGSRFSLLPAFPFRFLGLFASFSSFSFSFLSCPVITERTGREQETWIFSDHCECFPGSHPPIPNPFLSCPSVQGMIVSACITPSIIS